MEGLVIPSLVSDAKGSIEQGYAAAGAALAEERKTWSSGGREEFDLHVQGAIAGLSAKVAEARKRGKTSCEVMSFRDIPHMYVFQRHAADLVARILTSAGYKVSMEIEGASGLLDGRHGKHTLTLDFSSLYKL